MRSTSPRIGRIASLFICSLLPLAPAAGQDDPVDVEVFKGPQIRQYGGLRYPESEISKRHEGWVELDMMIDPKGKAYEVSIADSTGIEAFEKEALRALDTWRFTPASRGGTNIHSSYRLKIKFSPNIPARGAGKDFVNAYRDLMGAINASDRVKADGHLASLEARNLYEDAHRNLGKYHYHRKWGTEAEQLEDLRGAIAGEKAPVYLPKETFIGALGALLTLQVKTKDYGGALRTWEILQPIAPNEDFAPIQHVVEQIKKLRENDEAVRFPARISKGTSWHGELFKKRFEVAVSSGRVSEIKLRCEKQYLFFAHEPGVQYTVQARDGTCNIEVVGDQGTTFDLIQS